MRIEDRVEVTFAFDRALEDPIARMLVGHHLSNDPVRALAFRLLRPGDKVLDLGAHIGTFALPVAALGCRVLAVEASPENFALLRSAAQRNGLGDLEVLHAAVAGRAGTVRFAPNGPHGQADIARSGQDTIEVTAVAVDELLAARSWGDVHLVKIDIEGSEPQALIGMTELLTRPDAPPILIESNGHTLAHYGATTHDLRAVLEGFGYSCHLVDSSLPYRLVPVDADQLQPECVADYLAFKARPPELGPWFVSAPFGRAELVERVLSMCRDRSEHHRAYAAAVLRVAPIWMLAHPAIAAGMHALRSDPVAEVRAAAGTSDPLD
jgi:FkbM family methyltransferase